MEEYKQPICLNVKYELADAFISKVRSEDGCKVTKVIEMLTCKMLQYWIECPKEKEAIVTDYAFMTWIKNPVFQKYYHGIEAYEIISADYIKTRTQLS